MKTLGHYWVYDFDTQLDEPVDRLALADLPNRYGPLAFLFPTGETPVFRNNQEQVTRDAADRLATLFNKLVGRGVDRERAQRFVLQCLVALFSEDIGLLEKYTFARLLEECDTPAKAYDLIGGLFVEMNTPGVTGGGRFKGVDYFNGGIFSEPIRLELHPDELAQLKKAAESDWSMVRPEIFGTLFEHSTGKEQRHAFGAHFTSGVDIMKIVRPTIIEPWETLIEKAKTLKQLGDLHKRMQHYRVLDPACGSGNFLYLAYRSLKRLEHRLFERMDEVSTRQDKAQKRLSFVTAQQFYGIDIIPFAVELAKVTMMIARKLSIEELHMAERALPLDNLNDNFITGDALIEFPSDGDGQPTRTVWPEADVIIGNPPFTGAPYLEPARGRQYVQSLRELYPNVPGMADYCVYWFRRAHDRLPDCTAKDPVAGRAGLVGTQNIRNNKSREGGLDHILASGTVIEAVDNQPWSGEANVHVSIANWVKHAFGVNESDLLIPAERKLWSKVPPVLGPRVARPRGSGAGAKEYELDFRECECINSALSDGEDVSMAHRLTCNAKPKRVFRGQEPGNRGFVLSSSIARRFLEDDHRAAEVVYPHVVGDDLLSGTGKPSRYIIDFGNVDMLRASEHGRVFEHIRKEVLGEMRKIDDSSTEDRPKHGNKIKRSRTNKWWLLRRACANTTVKYLNSVERYIGCSRHLKRNVFNFISSSIRPDSAVQVFGFDDDYSFGILQADAHWQWFIAKCSKLKSDFRYTPESVFDTFAWPQFPLVKQIDAVAEAGREVRRVRDEALKKVKGGLRAVYRTLELPGKNPLRDAHAALDAAVLAAYGFNAKDDLLKQLLDLNLDVAARIERGEEVTAPGIPPGYPNPAELVTDDCIRPE